jgi:hypothetical protein
MNEIRPQSGSGSHCELGFLQQNTIFHSVSAKIDLNPQLDLS